MAQKYRVSGTLNHGVLLESADGDKPAKTRIDVYHDGDEFSTEDPKLEAELRRTGTILLPEEYAAAAASEGNVSPTEQLAQERLAKDVEIAQLRAELDALRGGQQNSSAEGEPPKSDSSEE